MSRCEQCLNNGIACPNCSWLDGNGLDYYKSPEDVLIDGEEDTEYETIRE